ncbi:MAG: GNAT family N-acetyltransferase [Saprospiraceae bacterium]|nr:GNAT family N-acetyltransferase [Saprospiraceae bacterium]
MKEIEKKKFVLEYGKPLKGHDFDHVAKWITNSGELPLISSAKECFLAPNEIMTWLNDAFEYAVVSFGDEIVGIATLTTKEADIPNDSIEICHCIVQPIYRRLYNGSKIILELTACAKKAGYRKVVGRVAVANRVGYQFLEFQNWKETPDSNYSNDTSVIWLEKTF